MGVIAVVGFQVEPELQPTCAWQILIRPIILRRFIVLQIPVRRLLYDLYAGRARASVASVDEHSQVARAGWRQGAHRRNFSRQTLAVDSQSLPPWGTQSLCA